MMLGTVTQAMCKFLNLKVGAMPQVAYKVPVDKVKYQDTWIDVIYGLISDTAEHKDGRSSAGIWYRLADVYGEVRLDSLWDLQLPLVLGDSSLAYGYSWESPSMMSFITS
ncbi:MAG: hypothetical protein ACLR8P_01465 [Clostridium fessum]